MSQQATRSEGLDFTQDVTRRMEDPEFAAEYSEALGRARLGLKIARLRAERGLSQAELAARVHTTQSVISRYESAAYGSYRLDTLQRLANALGAELQVDFATPERSEEQPVGS